MAAATEAAKRAAVGLHPTPSTFSELLRHSRFASFDPAIRQTYFSPVENVTRGDWGLKRPITLRDRNAYITLKDYEHRAFFVEWNRGDRQVKYIRKLEELNQRPRLPVKGSSWVGQLGKARREWVMDSDYCPEDEEVPPVFPEKAVQVFTSGVASLGNSGTGAYGANRPTKPNKDTPAYVQPNIFAMTPKEFKKYCRKIRELRPEFIAWLKEKAKTDSSIVGKRISDLLLHEGTNLHREFLADYWRKQFNNESSRTIGPQPHRFGGLTYTHRSALDIDFLEKPQPGMVLQEATFRKHRMASGAIDPGEDMKDDDKDCVASFAGLSVLFKKQNAGGVPPIFRNSEDPDPSKADESCARMKLVDSFLLYEVPKVVGPVAQGVKGARIQAEVRVLNEEVESIREELNLTEEEAREYLMELENDEDDDTSVWDVEEEYSPWNPRPAARTVRGNGMGSSFSSRDTIAKLSQMSRLEDDVNPAGSHGL